MGKPTALTVLGVALDLLQMGFALVVVIVTSWKLFNVDVEGTRVNSNCLLDGSGRNGTFAGTQFCIYAIAVGVISFVANAIFTCLRNICKCVTLNACSLSKVVAVIGDTALGIWWTVAFAFFVRRGTAANNLGWPERPARDGVIAASFGAMAAFFADVVITVCVVALS